MYKELAREIIGMVPTQESMLSTEYDELVERIVGKLESFEPTAPKEYFVCDADLKNNGGKELIIKTLDHDEFERAYKKAIQSGKYLIVRKYLETQST